jgi:glycolate oxidase
VIAAGIVPATLGVPRQPMHQRLVEDYAGLGLRRDAGALLLFGDDG